MFTYGIITSARRHMLVSQTVEFMYALVASARWHRFVKVEIQPFKAKITFISINLILDND